MRLGRLARLDQSPALAVRSWRSFTPASPPLFRLPTSSCESYGRFGRAPDESRTSRSFDPKLWKCHKVNLNSVFDYFRRTYKQRTPSIPCP
jgi:hypothetical protein